MTNVDTTPEQEVNIAPEETVNDTQDTIGDIVPEVEEAPKEKKPSVVPIARLDKEIARRKELEAKLAEYEAAVAEDGEPSDSTDVKELAKQIAEIKEKEQAQQRNAALNAGLQKALESAPEFKGVVNEDAIKQMALNPANKDKTFIQLIEEVYGNTVSGRRTIETATPRGGAKDTKIDEARAQRDPDYRKEVLSDPDLRKQYNEGLTDRLSRYL
jgi:hypothetical protein